MGGDVYPIVTDAIFFVLGVIGMTVVGYIFFNALAWRHGPGRARLLAIVFTAIVFMPMAFAGSFWPSVGLFVLMTLASITLPAARDDDSD